MRRLLVLALLLGLPALASPAEPGFPPRTTWLFVVGTLEWKHSEDFASFPKKDRRDAELVALFRSRGVPDSQIVYLQDRGATTQAIERELDTLLERTRPGDTLVLYYCGHGYKQNGGTGYFASYDAGGSVAGWAMADIPRQIEAHFKGTRALLMADACYSGQLALDVRRLASRVSYACLTSSSASASSTGNWTFTEAVLDALRGQAGIDGNGDGFVSLAEAAAYTADDMTIGEEQATSFITTGGFDARAPIATARPKSDPRVGNRVEVQESGKWWKARVVDAKQGSLQIHWLGFIGYPNEWVEPARVRSLRQSRVFPVGATVDVEWKGKYYPARVLKLQGPVHLIHYDGYGAEWDEWVASKRVRARS